MYIYRHTHIHPIYFYRKIKIYFMEIAHLSIENGKYRGKIWKVGQQAGDTGKALQFESEGSLLVEFPFAWRRSVFSLSPSTD